MGWNIRSSCLSLPKGSEIQVCVTTANPTPSLFIGEEASRPVLPSRSPRAHRWPPLFPFLLFNLLFNPDSSALLQEEMCVFLLLWAKPRGAPLLGGHSAPFPLRHSARSLPAWYKSRLGDLGTGAGGHYRPSQESLQHVPWLCSSALRAGSATRCLCGLPAPPWPRCVAPCQENGQNDLPCLV